MAPAGIYFELMFRSLSLLPKVLLPSYITGLAFSFNILPFCMQGSTCTKHELLMKFNTEPNQRSSGSKTGS